MKVFISWSGETSKNIAEILRQWLPSVIQVVKPYYSPDDIAKGARWSTEIAIELDESKIGLICLTKDNLSSPWIMFEAGALSKNIDSSKVCPILFGVEPSDIKGPLVQFQAAKFTKEEVKRVVRMMNLELGENSLVSEVFENVFEMWWPKLEEKVKIEMQSPVKSVGKNARSERDILEEILSLSRNITLLQARGGDKDRGVHPDAIRDLTSTYMSLVMAIIEDDKKSSVVAADQFFLPLDHIIRKLKTSDGEIRELRRDLDVAYTRLREYDIQGTAVLTSNRRRVRVVKKNIVKDIDSDFNLD
jgi:hypothetical protein